MNHQDESQESPWLINRRRWRNRAENDSMEINRVLTLDCIKLRVCWFSSSHPCLMISSMSMLMMLTAMMPPISTRMNITDAPINCQINQISQLGSTFSLLCGRRHPDPIIQCQSRPSVSFQNNNITPITANDDSFCCSTASPLGHIHHTLSEFVDTGRNQVEEAPTVLLVAVIIDWIVIECNAGSGILKLLSFRWL